MARALPGWVKASLVALALAASTALVGYGALRGDVATNAARIIEHKARIDKAQDNRFQDREALSAVKEDVSAVKASVDSLRATIETQRIEQRQDAKALKEELTRAVWQAVRRGRSQ